MGRGFFKSFKFPAALPGGSSSPPFPQAVFTAKDTVPSGTIILTVNPALKHAKAALFKEQLGRELFGFPPRRRWFNFLEDSRVHRAVVLLAFGDAAVYLYSGGTYFNDARGSAVAEGKTEIEAVKLAYEKTKAAAEAKIDFGNEAEMWEIIKKIDEKQDALMREVLTAKDDFSEFKTKVMEKLECMDAKAEVGKPQEVGKPAATVAGQKED